MTKRCMNAVATVLALALGGAPALAEPARGFSAKGSVARPVAVTIAAPMGGQVEDFAWAAGDAVEAGSAAVAIVPSYVCAAEGGVVAGLRAMVGDSAQDVIAQYGALCYVERQDVWRIDASTSGAYDDPDNRDVRVGQIVRVQHGTGDDKVRGEATVISVEGKDYMLELEQGDFELEDSVKLYLNASKDNASKDQIGSGKIVRAEALKALGDGTVAQVLVGEGDSVKRGQPLFAMDGASARYEPGSDVAAEALFPDAGAIGEVLVRPGQFVQQGQALMTLLPTGGLEVSLEVDELDIARVRVGDSVRVSVDAHEGDRMGTVREVRKVGTTVLDTTKFDVRVVLSEAGDLMIGMHATGYWD